MFRPIIAVVVFALGAVALAPAAAAQASVRSFSVQSFSFDSFSADYYLGLDSHGRTTLKTVETLVAEFPQFDQNHGILRLIPDTYDGHPIDLTVTSVTDGAGNPRPFRAANDDEEESDADGFYQLVSRDSGYVHGNQTYVITYTQHNVTRYFADTHDDEFYWNTNGTGWQQSFGVVSARVHVAPALAKAYNSKSACYQGGYGSSQVCTFTVAKQSNGGLLMTANAKNLDAGQNLTVALGFRPGTIVPRDASFFASPFAVPLVVFLILGLLVFCWILLLRLTKLRDARGRGIVIAQYTPPKDVDLLTDAVLLGRVKRAAASQIVDLAVRGNLRIVEDQPEGILRHRSFTIELVSPTGLDDTTTEFARIFLPLEVGARYTLGGKDTVKARKVYRLLQSTKRSLVAQGLTAKRSLGTTALPFLAALAAAAGVVVFAWLMLGDARGGAAPLLLGLPVVVALIIGLRLLGHVPLTAAGADLRDYLKGLELYIRMAEADRLRVLQSPEGAQRVAVSTTDPHEMLKLTEALLPYAVLFELEKEWASVIGKYYDSGSSPDWYSGSSAFNAAIFASSIGAFTSSSASSFSGSAASGSSSGGSGGGGFSGGGGGGGGGGGV